MSLEQALERCAQALENLTAALINRTNLEDSPSATESQRKSTKKTPGPQKPAAEVSTPAPGAEIGSDLYQQAAAVITSLSRQKGREVALRVLAAFGANKLPAVTQDRLQDVINAAQRALEAAE
jgi:hypothetical protein